MFEHALRFLVPVLSAFAIACGESGETSGTGGQVGLGGTSATGAVGGSSTGGSSTGGIGGGATGGAGGTPQQCEGTFQLCCDDLGNKASQICAGSALVCPPGTHIEPWTNPGSPCPKPGQCTPSKPCATTEYCDYPDDRCGSVAFGTCKPRPAACDAVSAPVCSCAYTVEVNECTAYSNGSDLSATGACTPPKGEFPCGAIFCTEWTQYCRVKPGDGGAIANSYSCSALPSGCGSNPSCACLVNELCGASCTADVWGNMQLTCPGG